MSDFDLAAPSMPKKKEGIFKRFFVKDESKETPAPAPTPAAKEEGPIDLEDIKRKLGLDDDLSALSKVVEAPAAQPQAPSPKVDDWTAEEHLPPPLPAQSTFTQDIEVPITTEVPIPTAVPTEPLLHHVAVDKLLAPTKELTIQQVLQSTALIPDLPDWKVQDKEVPPESYFILRNGQPVRSLRELADAVDFIDDSTFDHHVNEYRNDFANWIRDVIGNSDLADEVAQAQDKPGIMRALLGHYKNTAKQMEKEQQKLQVTVKKRQDTLKKLGGVEDQIAQMRKQLEQKSKELHDERKHSAKLIKDKLDAEVTRRLETERQALVNARAELAKAKQSYSSKEQEYQVLVKSLSDRDTTSAQREREIARLRQEVKNDQEQLEEEKRKASSLLKDSEILKKQFEDMKTLDAQAKKNLDAISKREIDISRREEALRSRETKITTDLTRVQESQDKLAALKEEHAKREAAVKQLEADAKKQVVDAEARTKAAADTERKTRDAIQQESKKLDSLRKQIDGALAKAMGQKKKITQAVALRKHLETAIMQTQKNISVEHDEMEKDAYKSYMDTKIDTTPIGQPSVPATKDILFVNEKELPIYSKVEECRRALDKRDIAHAKQLYSELRDDFGKLKLDATEKSMLYNSIRELYDDIHLAMLG